MKIAIISDTHFGYKEDTEQEYDSYINAEQALQEAVKEADLILMPGDIFDLEIPSQKTLEATFQLFAQFVDSGKQEEITKTITKKPIVVIPGTHEYRGKGYTSPIDVLESAKYICQLKHNNIVFESSQEKVIIFGMSGVPEKVAKEVLHKLDFKPIPDVINILMTHQSYKELLGFDDEMISTLTFEDLPDGFDLYINGHIHQHQILETNKGTIVVPGSTILTQTKKSETENKKGFVLYDTITKKLEFIQIPIQRKYFYFEINEKNTTKEELHNKITNLIATVDTKEHTKTYKISGKEIMLKPIIKIKISATIGSGESSAISEKEFKGEDYLLIIDKKIETEELKEKINAINFESDRQSALEKSKDIFYKNLEDAGFKNSFNINEFLQMTNEKDTEKATEYILEKIKTELENENKK